MFEELAGFSQFGFAAVAFGVMVYMMRENNKQWFSLLKEHMENEISAIRSLETAMVKLSDKLEWGREK